MNSVAARLQADFPSHLEDLKRLARIPSVSFAGFPEAEVRRSASEVAKLLRDRGLENVRVLELPGTHPYVYGEWLRAPGAPTLLLYAHHDVQPPGRENLWESPPFEPTHRNGPGGERLYGRGTADDKAGIIVHTAAIASHLAVNGKLPVNVKVLIEGEEEIGSPALPQFLTRYRELLQSDVLVLTDTTNFDCGWPALTVSLRGLVGLEVELRALKATVHSGMWGGPVPDVASALSKMLASLTDSEGRIAVAGFWEAVRPITAEEKAAYARVPCDPAEFAKQCGMVPGARMVGGFGEAGKKGDGLNPLVTTWRLPSLTVNAIQSSSRAQAGNTLNDTAWAKITVRIVPDMEPEAVLAQLKDHLRHATPWGLEVSFKAESGNDPWMADQTSPRARSAFQAAEAAIEKGYGRAPLRIGCGASIPFVQPLCEAMGGAPALLIGVEDPYTNAHGENESLLISDLQAACVSQAYLFEELARGRI